MRKTILGGALSLVLAGFTSASAADHGTAAPEAMPSSGWTYQFTPYAWLTFITGEVTIKGRTFDVKTDIFEILRESDSIIGAMGTFEARRGPLSLYADTIYAKVTFSGGATKFFQPSRRISGTLGVQVGAEYEYAIVEAGGAYEIAKLSNATAVDLLAGARYWHQNAEVDVDLAATINLGGLAISGTKAIAASGDVNWVDPLVGLRVRHQVAPGQVLMLRGDVGGFGVSSDFAWQLWGGYSWEMCDSNGIVYSGILGYRALYTDYSKGSGFNEFEYDLLQHGPVMGLNMRF